VEGRTIGRKRALVKDIAEAVVRNFDVSADRVMVQIVESLRENKAKGGVLFDDRT
jgi:4-oxalocrotonate tautomerase